MIKITLHDSKDLQWWYYQHLEGRIDLSPPYQRRSSIWSKWKQAHLIDSLINGFDVPKLYFGNFLEMPNSAALNASGSAYAVIDGKQRLGAIFSFFKDELRLNKSSVFEDDLSQQIQGLSYTELKMRHPFIAARVERFLPAVMSVVTNDVRKIEELFIRLNMGEAANGAEQRNAMGGPIPELVRELALHPFFVKKIKFSTNRMQEFNLIAKLLLIEYKQSLVDTKKSDLDSFAQLGLRLAKEVDDPNHYLERGEFFDAKERVLDCLEVLAPEFSDRDPLLASSGSIPIYYWWTRTHKRKVGDLHGFLTDLNEKIKDATKNQKAGAPADNRLLSYYTASRTTNDGESLRTRLRIFEELYREWTNPGARAFR
ncbi:DUF262 domain-containing protein [Hydrogenophaga sp. ANAO-22]|jgi:hypothetical protein|uniref:DUF262 domain-containing protein n=1 Tax=Hydrogenophaga sp. ANAO-22 TaxID=3166645 RepID=UPI0036D24346